MIAIIDYDAGNIQSVYKALKHIDCDVVITRDTTIIKQADGMILPGVGSFGDTVDNMERFGMSAPVMEYISSGKPFLGICLGLHLLFPASEESPEKQGLGLLQGTITKIPANGLKIPHMGWNSLDIRQKDGLFKGITGSPYVYFVHSYYLSAQDKAIVSSTTEYGVTIDASVGYNNVMATQFHPEKSGDTGLKILKNFSDIVWETANKK